MLHQQPLDRKKLNDEVYEYCRSAPMTYTDFCDKAGVNRAMFTTTNYWRGGMRFDILEKVCKVLGTQPARYSTDIPIKDDRPNRKLGVYGGSVTTEDAQYVRLPRVTRTCVRCGAKFRCDTLDYKKQCDSCLDKWNKKIDRATKHTK